MFEGTQDNARWPHLGLSLKLVFNHRKLGKMRGAS